MRIGRIVTTSVFLFIFMVIAADALLLNKQKHLKQTNDGALQRTSRQIFRNPNWFNGPNQGFPVWNNRRRFYRRPQIDDDDFFVFDVVEPTSNNVMSSTSRPEPTSTIAIPGMGTTRTPCEDACLTTPQYNPVCGSDDVTYFSSARLQCAQRCGKRVRFKHIGMCSLRGPIG